MAAASRRGKQVRHKSKKKRNNKSAHDEKLCMTKGQMRNIVHAAEDPHDPDCCPHALKFVRQLKKEVR